MYKYTKSQLPAMFNNYFELIIDVHPYNTRQIKTRQFVLPKAHSNSGANMIKYSAVEIWPKNSSGNKKNVFGTFLAEYKDSFTQNPVTAYDPTYGQQQSSHQLR